MFLPRRSRRYIALVVSTLSLMVLLSTTALAKNLYVNGSTGSDTVTYNDNTEATPWRTLGRAVWGNASRGSADTSQAAQAGDVVTVASGTYNTTFSTGLRYEPVYNPVNQGAWNATTNVCNSTITFRASTQYGVTLTAPTTGDDNPVIGTYQRNCIIWDGFYIDATNANSPGDGGVASIWAANGSQLINNDFQARDKQQSEGNNHNVVRLESTYGAVVKNNKIHGSTGNSGVNDTGITTYNCASCLIENNNIYNNTTGISYKGDSTDPSRAPRQSNITIRYNLIYNNVGMGIVLMDSVDDSSNINRVYQNLVYNNGSTCIQLRVGGPGPRNLKIVNNTCYNATTRFDVISMMQPGSGHSIRNNIMVNATEVLNAGGITSSPPSYFEADYNLYHLVSRWSWNGATYSTLNAWRTALGGCPSTTVGRDCSSMTGDPLFVSAGSNNFRLQVNSPARGAGIDVLDLNGNGRTDDPITLGAYITGNEIFGVSNNGAPPSLVPAAPTGLTVR